MSCRIYSAAPATTKQMFALDWGHCNLYKRLLQLQLWCQISQISKLMWQFILFKSLWKTEKKKKKLMKQFCPGGADGKASCLQCGRPGFNPWVRKILWRRKWQPTLVLLPVKSHGQRSMVGYSPWGRKESDTTERLHFHFHALRTSIGSLISVVQSSG